MTLRSHMSAITQADIRVHYLTVRNVVAVLRRVIKANV